jgi:hypothetical protein
LSLPEIEDTSSARPVLGEVCERLNRDCRVSVGNRGQARGLAMLAVPLKKSLLCAPTDRSKIIPKKSTTSEVGQSDRRRGKQGKTDLAG